MRHMPNPRVFTYSLCRAKPGRGQKCLSQIISSCYSSLSKSNKDARRQRVVILGSGWAGYTFSRTLDPSKYERIVISPRSYFVFTPLLASTSVGTLEFRAVLEPVRRLPGGVRFHQGWADEVDFSRKVVRVEANAVDPLPDAMPPTSLDPSLALAMGFLEPEVREETIAPAEKT